MESLIHTNLQQQLLGEGKGGEEKDKDAATIARMKQQLESLVVILEENAVVDDTRFEKLLDVLKKYCQPRKPFLLLQQQQFLRAGFWETMEVCGYHLFTYWIYILRTKSLVYF